MKKALSLIFITLLLGLSAVAGNTDKRKTSTKSRSHKKTATVKKESTQETEGVLFFSRDLDNHVMPNQASRDVIIYDTPSEPVKVEVKKENNNSKVFEQVEQMPEYPGGLNELMKDLCAHISYPESAKERKAEGRVIVRFIVNETGEISSPTVVKSVAPDLDRVAVAAIKGLKKFATPGKINGQAVKVYYTLPISFTLTDK